jgi:hypothetical protein
VTKIRKLMAVGAMALMMMVVALPSALAQDWCFWGCDYWGADYWDTPTETATTEETPAEERFIILAADDDCVLVWDTQTDELFWVCEVD